MSRLTKTFPVNRRVVRRPGGSDVGMAPRPEREHAAEREPVRETREFSTPMPTMDHRAARERP